MTALQPAPVLRMSELRFRWPGAAHYVLDMPGWNLGAAERLLVRGPSGCGKSTLLSLAAGVLLPSAGRVELLGQDWQGLGAGARDQRRVDHVGYVFQQFNLLPYLCALDNVLLPCRFSPLRARRAGASLEQAAQTLLDALDLPAALWRKPAGELSVGQQQRVAAARALIGQPQLIIADEPTSALDDERRDAFMRLLLARCQAAGSALLFVSHDARLAPHFDRVLELAAINRAPQGAREG